MRDLDAIKSDPRIHSVYKDPPDGWWVMTKSGFAFDPGSHTTSESTVRALKRRLREIEPCDCEDCARKDRL